ncbi:MAG TPA: hypothetical protein VGO23_11385, partial [Pseudonocardia sp.]|nr:hypothetical protein [Pseudonocardia sp.]
MSGHVPGRALPRLEPVGRRRPDPAALLLVAHGGRAGSRESGVPIVLVGHSIGGRAVLRAAGADGVVSVSALAPRLDGS